MTLGAWFQTYVFLPLEYARKRVKFYRLQTDLVILFFLVGLWHGASWNLAIWGSINGGMLGLERLQGKKSYYNRQR